MFAFALAFRYTFCVLLGTYFQFYSVGTHFSHCLSPRLACYSARFLSFSPILSLFWFSSFYSFCSFTKNHIVFFSVLLSLVLHSLTQSKIWNTNEIEFESETWLQMCFHTVHVHRELACKQNDCQTYPSQFGDVAGDNVCFIIILKWAGLQSQLVIFFLTIDIILNDAGT